MFLDNLVSGLSLLPFSTKKIHIRRELKYCAAFQCKTIHFTPSFSTNDNCGNARYQSAGKPSWTIDPQTGSWLYGELDDKGEFTGENIAYIYPDNITAYLGEFDNGVMMRGRKATVISKSQASNGSLDVKFEMSEDLSTVSYEPSTFCTFGNEPKIKDPYESTMVYVGKSGTTGAGEGLFALRDTPTRTLMAFYNGFRIPVDVDFEKDLYAFDENKRLTMKMYTIKLGDSEDFYLDIPPREGQDRSLYSATLGHKVNHSFRPNCRYTTLVHPRWGLIVGVTSSRPIAKDEELFCNYGYKPDSQMVPDWFRDLYKKHQARHD